MLFYKITGTLIVLACGVAGARLLNNRDSAEVVQVGALLELLRFSKIQIECFSLAAPQILSRLDIKDLFLCGYEDDTPPQSFDELASRIKISNKEARKIFSDFAENFGRSYRDEQLRQCEYHIEQLEALNTRLQEALSEKRRLNSTLCAAGALAIIILLI